MSSVYKDRKSPIFGMIMFVIVLSVLLAAIFGVFVIDLSTTGTVETETHVTSIATGVLYDAKHLGVQFLSYSILITIDLVEGK